METKSGGGKPLLIRWTTDFDCQEETEWWYCIKDTPFDINTLKKKRRYEINKGKKNFEVNEINPLDFQDDIYNVYKESVNSYSKQSYRLLSKEKFITEIKQKENVKIYGAFEKKTNKLCSYALLIIEKNYINFSVLKSIPAYEKFGVNAAIVSQILEDFNKDLNEHFYICDGERNVLHETSFQNYLEKYFGFRKAYCRLNIEYVFWMRIIVNILFPLRKVIKKLDNRILFRKVNALLYMEELKRKSFNKGEK